MSKSILVLLRISLGWLMLYAGITKVLNPDWSAAGYLAGAKTFSGFYGWLAGGDILPFINIMNEWGLTLLGISLIAGVFVRWSAPLGALLMLLYYIPTLAFPMVGDHSYIVDDHIIYALVLLYFSAVGAGNVWGIDGWLRNRNQ